MATKSKPKSKTEIVAALLRRKVGCTRADVLEATSWTAVSMQQMAAAASLKLRLEKEQGAAVIRYFGS